MRQFWDIAIEPVLTALRPRRIVEIGVDRGLTTRPLMEFAESRGALVETIDPDPKFDTAVWEQEHPDAVRFHRGLSLDVLPRLEPVQAALIDGDHNWYTVRNELAILERVAGAGGVTPPVVLLHDVGWPYGHRDLYYDPETIPAAHRQPYARRGLLPGQSELVDEGLNDHLQHALDEGGAHNGVRPAIEEFIDESATEWSLTILDAGSGLGVLCPTALLEENARLSDVIEGFSQPQQLTALIALVEAERIDAEIRRQRSGRRLAAATEESDALRAQLEALPSAEPEWRRRLEQALLDATRDNAEAEGRLAGRQHEVDFLQAALKEEHRVASEATEEARTARREARASDEARETVEHRAGEFERRAAEDERRADAAQRAVREREREIEQLSAASARLAADLEDVRETLEAALGEARAEAGTARVVARELRGQLKLREIENAGLDEELRLLRQSVVEARADAAIACAQRDALAPQLAALTAERDAAIARANAQPAPPDRHPSADPVRLSRRALSEPEAQAQASFLRAYPEPPPALRAPAIVDSTALPTVSDLRGVLVDEHEPGEAATVDVIVCVHDALDDVRRCLWSIVEKSGRRLRLVLVNDGSDEATTEYLRSVAATEPRIHLIENLEPPHGYTIAANLGLRAATGDYLVLLNSDTIVTRGWLERILDCGESDAAIGILGPLSNAASHQSVPELRTRDGWATNPLPSFVTPDGIAALLPRLRPPLRPRIPFINGFCFVIRRAVIDAIGYFDEERFASGYCEENDYCVRAADAGFVLAVVDDGYVFHAKSKSFTSAGRDVLAKRNYQIFREKHGGERIDAMVNGLESDQALTPLRASVRDALSGALSLASALDCPRLDPLRIVFVLPGLGLGGSGGSHSIFQEVTGLRTLGQDAQIALAIKAMPRARDAYDDADAVFAPYGSVDELAKLTAGADVVVATHFKSAALVNELHEQRDDFLPAYYIQDYEPFFTVSDSADFAEAHASYTLIPGCLLFAKTHWLCNIVAERHGVAVAKVEPSIDESIYRPPDGRTDSGPVRIAAMVRPRTPRRQPTATVATLEALSAGLGAQVQITTFGCPEDQLAAFTDHEPLLRRHRGILSRAHVAELLGQTDVLLDLSMYQAFGRTALEAMACGATAIVPRLGGVWEFVEHRQNAIAIDAFEPQQAVDAIGELVADRSLLRHLRTRARETASGYSILRASLSEYLLFSAEHRRRHGARQAGSVESRSA